MRIWGKVLGLLVSETFADPYLGNWPPRLRRPMKGWWSGLSPCFHWAWQLAIGSLLNFRHSCYLLAFWHLQSRAEMALETGVFPTQDPFFAQNRLKNHFVGCSDECLATVASTGPWVHRSTPKKPRKIVFWTNQFTNLRWARHHLPSCYRRSPCHVDRIPRGHRALKDLFHGWCT